MMNLVTTSVPSSADLEVIGKAARLHYEYGLTHQEVADVLHVSRVKVTRLLKAGPRPRNRPDPRPS